MTAAVPEIAHRYELAERGLLADAQALANWYRADVGELLTELVALRKAMHLLQALPIEPTDDPREFAERILDLWEHKLPVWQRKKIDEYKQRTEAAELAQQRAEESTQTAMAALQEAQEAQRIAVQHAAEVEVKARGDLHAANEAVREVQEQQAQAEQVARMLLDRASTVRRLLVEAADQLPDH